jgi:hypothetical protein
MHRLFFLVFTFILFTFNVLSSTFVIENAKVSCVRYVGWVETNENQEIKPKLFFWDDEQGELAHLALGNGYRLEKSIYSDMLCGAYTPIISVSNSLSPGCKLCRTLARAQIRYQIEQDPTAIDSVEKAWTADIVFVQE